MRVGRNRNGCKKDVFGLVLILFILHTRMHIIICPFLFRFAEASQVAGGYKHQSIFTPPSVLNNAALNFFCLWCSTLHVFILLFA